MDFVDGGSLAEVLAVYQTLPEEIIAFVAQSVRTETTQEMREEKVLMFGSHLVCIWL